MYKRQGDSSVRSRFPLSRQIGLFDGVRCLAYLVLYTSKYTIRLLLLILLIAVLYFMYPGTIYRRLILDRASRSGCFGQLFNILVSILLLGMMKSKGFMFHGWMKPAK